MQKYFWTVGALFSFSILQLAGDAAGQFTAASLTCPGDMFTFRCTVGDRNGVTIWRVGGSSECSLLHSTASAPGPCGSGSSFTVTAGSEFGTSVIFFTSTLSGTATSALDGTLVECFGPGLARDAENRVGKSTIQVLGPPTVPTLSCAGLSGDVSGAVNVTVSWTLSVGDSADFYLINITTNASQIPYGGLMNIITASVTQRKLTGFMTGYEYNITVRGVNCGSLEGNESEPLTITPQVPATPVSDVCAVYDTVNGTLQIIEVTWNEVDPVTVTNGCENEQDINYDISYATDSGTPITTCVVDGTECSNGTCHHELQDNAADSRCQPPLSEFSGEGVTVSVTARNTVGRSHPAVSRSINGININILGVRVDTTNPSDLYVECTILQPGYTCTVDYGTDPSYTNLVYRDTSSTLGRRATITLSQRLRTDTAYYYIVSVENTTQCVRVQGRFQIGCSVNDLTLTNTVGQCADRGFTNTVTIPSGMVCHSRTTAGSEAVYICDDGFHQDGAATRVCQSDGVWNGSIPQCLPDQDGRDGAVESLTTSAAVGIAVATATVVAFIAGVVTGVLLYHFINKHQSQSSKPQTSSQHQQPQATSSSNPLQQTGPEYAEVIRLKQNKAYEPHTDWS